MTMLVRFDLRPVFAFRPHSVPNFCDILLFAVLRHQEADLGVSRPAERVDDADDARLDPAAVAVAVTGGHAHRPAD